MPNRFPQNIREFFAVRPRLLIVVIGLIAFVPGLFSLPPSDRDEARYAQATKQMLETGDYVDIRFQQDSRYKKPIGIYWFQAGANKIFGAEPFTQIWIYRLPSILAALLAGIVTFEIGRRWFTEREGLIAGLLLSSAVMVAVEANLAKTDAALLLFVAVAQGVLGLTYIQSKSRVEKSIEWIVPVIFWSATGLGILIKGPIAPLISMLTIVGLVGVDREWRWVMQLRPLLGLGIVALLVAPWAVAVGIVTEGAFYREALGGDLLPKLVSSQETHGAPPGYYTALAAFTFWPAALFLAPSLFAAWQTREQTAVRFCLAWIIPTWVVFELVPTKLPHYVLPLLPAFALLAAVYITNFFNGQETPWLRRLSLAAFVVWMITAVALSVAPIALSLQFDQPLSIPMIVCSLAVLAAAVWTVAVYRRHDRTKLIAPVVLTGLLAYWSILEVALPRSNDLWMSRSLAQTIDGLAAGATGPVLASSGYAEPSLVFLAGTEINLVPAEKSAAILRDHDGAFAIIEQRVEAEFHQAIEEMGISVQQVATETGFNYSLGRTLSIKIYKRQ